MSKRSFSSWPILAGILGGVVVGGCSVSASIGTPGPGDQQGGADTGQGGRDNDAGTTGPSSLDSCGSHNSPSDDSSVLRNECGVFVSPSGDDASLGTKEHPLRTIGKGITVAHAAGKSVFVCVGEYPERVTLTDGVDVFGGVDCAGYNKSTGTSHVAPPGTDANPPVLMLQGASKGVRIERFVVDAPVGTASGASSIAMLVVDASAVSLVDVTLHAGQGRDGAAGANGAAGPSGASGGDGGGSIECPTDGSGGGGKGAAGMTVAAGGVGGTAICASTTSSMRAGVAASVLGAACGHGGAFDPFGACGVGEPGCLGSNGTRGIGGANAGVINATNGYSPTNSGRDGVAGGDGGGGGGGSAGSADTSFGKTHSGGGGGGGGGSGGGGTAGKGGQAGGASFALVSLRSQVQLVACTLRAENGGKGGDGGLGGSGGPGGVAGGGGASLTGADGAGCLGGLGGDGGKGGDGGGGGGGPSIALAYVGSTPKIDPTTQLAHAVGGPGGSKTSGPSAGANGLTSAIQQLSD